MIGLNEVTPMPWKTALQFCRNLTSHFNRREMDKFDAARDPADIDRYHLADEGFDLDQRGCDFGGIVNLADDFAEGLTACRTPSECETSASMPPCPRSCDN